MNYGEQKRNLILLSFGIVESKNNALKKAKDSSNKGGEHWITINGRHMLIGGSGEVKQGGSGMADGKDIKKVGNKIKEPAERDGDKLKDPKKQEAFSKQQRAELDSIESKREDRGPRPSGKRYNHKYKTSSTNHPPKSKINEGDREYRGVALRQSSNRDFSKKMIDELISKVPNVTNKELNEVISEQGLSPHNVVESFNEWKKERGESKSPELVKKINLVGGTLTNNTNYIGDVRISLPFERGLKDGSISNTEQGVKSYLSGKGMTPQKINNTIKFLIEKDVINN